jgi:hypothetical protein
VCGYTVTAQLISMSIVLRHNDAIAGLTVKLDGGVRHAYLIEQRLRPLATRECAARCWPPVPPRARCDCLMDALVSPRSFSRDQ